MKFAVLSAGTVLLQLALALALNNADGDRDQLSGYPRVRRGWSMMRLGRGLQMLRLGKRMAPPPSSHNLQATPQKMRELLDELLDTNQDDFRLRQLLLLPQEMDEDVLEELNNLLEEPSQSDFRPYYPVHTNRFKRSTSEDLKTRREQTFDFDQAFRLVSPANARIAQYLGRLYKLPRAESDTPMLKELGHQKVDDGDVMIIDATGSDDMTSERSADREKLKKLHVTDPEPL